MQSLATGDIEVHVDEFINVLTPHISLREKTALMKQQKRSFSTESVIKRGITSTEFKKADGSENIIQYFNNRSITCGELRSSDVGKAVQLVGWIDSKKHGRFLQIRDGYGHTQIVVDSEVCVMFM